jgi:putative metallohydrolase (TIGR04338 family)
MKHGMRDSNRSKVYAAERTLVFKLSPTTPNPARYVYGILDSNWFKKYKPPVVKPKNPVDYDKYSNPCNVKSYQVRIKRKGSYRSAANPSYMELAHRSTGNYSIMLILHELAHSVQREGPWHGRQFCHIYLDLVKRYLGKEWYDSLKGSFRAHGVKLSRFAKRGKKHA